MYISIVWRGLGMDLLFLKNAMFFILRGDHFLDKISMYLGVAFPINAPPAEISKKDWKIGEFGSFSKYYPFSSNFFNGVATYASLHKNWPIFHLSIFCKEKKLTWRRKSYSNILVCRKMLFLSRPIAILQQKWRSWPNSPLKNNAFFLL